MSQHRERIRPTQDEIDAWAASSLPAGEQARDLHACSMLALELEERRAAGDTHWTRPHYARKSRGSVTRFAYYHWRYWQKIIEEARRNVAEGTPGKRKNLPDAPRPEWSPPPGCDEYGFPLSDEF